MATRKRRAATRKRSGRKKATASWRQRLWGLLWRLALVGVVLGGVLLVYLNAQITATFDQRIWQLPARVYARPLELYPGARLTPDELDYELRLLGYRNVDAVRDPGQRRQQGNRFDIYSRGFDFPDDDEPARPVTLTFEGARVVSLASRGSTLNLMRLEPVEIGGVYPAHGEDRLLVRLADVPQELVGALLAVEDRDFYAHHGISLTGIARAALANLRSGQVVAGGSTITQQLVKNYYLTPERSLQRKITEVLMALLLDFHYDKDQILENYINEIYLGQSGPRGIHGFALASLHYFDRPLEELGIHQQALLVGMIKGPSLYNPRRNPERALKRRNVVLDVMVEQGVISAERATLAAAMPLGLQARDKAPRSWPAYLDLVRRQLRSEYRDEDLSTLGLRIFTAFDPILQRQLEASVNRQMGRIDPDDTLETAAVVTRFNSGEVAALAGGRQARYAGFNRALDARRPAGSLLKPAVYLAALEKPERYSLASVLDDSPLSVPTAAGPVWEPRNFDRQSHGNVLLHSALARSYNLASARLGLELGLPVVTDMLHRLGIEREQPEVPALTLGAGEYAPWDIAAMYQTIASGGFRTPLRSIRAVVDADGRAMQRYHVDLERAVSLQAAHLLQYALREVVQEGTGRGVYRELPAGFAVAGKTGTTNDGRDSWFAGFSGDLLTVSWVGRDDNGATGLTGASGALRIWADFMARASRRPLVYRMPEGMQTMYVDDRDGRLTGKGCDDARLLPFITGSEPTASTRCTSRGQPLKGLRGWFESLFSGDD